MRWKKIRRGVEYPVVGLAFALAGLAVGCLTYRGLRRLAHGLAPVVRHLFPGGMRLVKANLAVAFPEWDDARRACVAKAAMANGILGVLEFLWFTRHPSRLKHHVDFSGRDAQRILAPGHSSRGAVMVTPHLGNWELLGQAAAAYGLPLSAVAHPIRNPWLARAVGRSRAYHGLGIVASAGGARAILRLLRTGRPVGILMDQNTRPTEGGIFVDFFGLPVSVSRAPAAMARRCGAEVMVAACVREDGVFRLRDEALPRPGREYETDLELTEDIMRANEALVRRYPEQYAWLYRRWRYIPEGLDEHRTGRFPKYAKPWRDPGTASPGEAGAPAAPP